MQLDDGLRHSYLTTRLALLEGRILDPSRKCEKLLDGMGGEEYLALRSQLLRERFQKRRPLREAINLAAASIVTVEDPSPAETSAVLSSKRVVEEYSFAGMGHIFDHHKAPVTRVVWANGDSTLLALCCQDGSVSLVSTDGTIVQQLKRPSKKACVATDVAWSLTNEWLLVGYETGVAALYVVKTAALLRYVKEESAVVSCGFHPQNPNHFLVVSKGAARIYNASTGLVIANLQVRNSCGFFFHSVLFTFPSISSWVSILLLFLVECLLGNGSSWGLR